jgi:snoRNA binding domain, fibrillarin
VAPNLSALIGEVVGARLISHAGSLTNLAKYPVRCCAVNQCARSGVTWGQRFLTVSARASGSGCGRGAEKGWEGHVLVVGPAVLCMQGLGHQSGMAS